MILLIAPLGECAADPTTAGQPSAASGTPGQQPSSGDQESPDYNGLDYTRPQQNVELRLQGRGSSALTSATNREVEFLKLSTKLDLGAGWKFGLQGQLPLVERAATDLSTGSVDREAGIGDVFTQAVLAQTIDSHWAYGFGARLVAPTGPDSLGSGRWQFMPGFGVRYSFLETSDTYFVPTIRYAMSFSGDPARRNISQPEIAPTLNIALPEHWFFTFYPSNDIRINFGDPVPGQTGRLFLPFDVAVGRNIGERLTVSLEASVPIIKDYPVYDFKTELRVGMKF